MSHIEHELVNDDRVTKKDRRRWDNENDEK